MPTSPHKLDTFTYRRRVYEVFVVAAHASAAEQAPLPAARGGRPEEYDWPGAHLHADQGDMRPVMTEGEAQSTPWPADGITMAEALWRVVDRLQRTTPELRASVAENVAIRQFRDLMQRGRYRATGRRAAAVPPLSTAKYRGPHGHI
jgi:hypothetical protein